MSIHTCAEYAPHAGPPALVTCIRPSLPHQLPQWRQQPDTHTHTHCRNSDSFSKLWGELLSCTKKQPCIATYVRVGAAGTSAGGQVSDMAPATRLIVPSRAVRLDGRRFDPQSQQRRRGCPNRPTRLTPAGQHADSRPPRVRPIDCAGHSFREKQFSTPQPASQPASRPAGHGPSSHMRERATPRSPR